MVWFCQLLTFVFLPPPKSKKKKKAILKNVGGNVGQETWGRNFEILWQVLKYEFFFDFGGGEKHNS